MSAVKARHPATMQTRSLTLALFATAAAFAASSAGCGLIAGVHDVVLGETGGTGGAGGTGAGGSTTTDPTTGGGGSTGGTASTGGSSTGGGGSAPFECAPTGQVFDLFPSDASAVSGDRMFLVSTPGVLPPRAHAVRVYDSTGGHVVVRTVKNVGILSDEVTWNAPPGAWTFGQGRISQNGVAVQGGITTASGPTAAEVRFQLDGEQQVESGQTPDLQTFPLAQGCAQIQTATLSSIAFVEDGTGARYAATLDNCTSGRRALFYYEASGGTQYVRDGLLDEASLALRSYARAGTSDVLLFSNGMQSFFSAGTTLNDLQQTAKAVAFGDATTFTIPLGIGAIGATDVGFWWALGQNGAIVPASLYGGTLSTSQLSGVAQSSSYSLLETYSEFEAVSNWSRPSVSADNIAVAGVGVDLASIRLSVFDLAAKPLVLDLPVATGGAGELLDASAVHFGKDVVLVAWISKTNQERHYQARAFSCK